MGHETAHGFSILAVEFYSQLGGVFGARIGFCGVKHGGGEILGDIEGQFGGAGSSRAAVYIIKLLMLACYVSDRVTDSSPSSLLLSLLFSSLLLSSPRLPLSWSSRRIPFVLLFCWGCDI